ncbi:MAG: HGGxSTG domain-containing protein [Alphaproteobacteria bacterium]
MQASPRCGAKTRRGTSCRAPAMSGKRRCRMHGGAVQDAGAPLNNQNALKHGETTRKAKARDRALRQLLVSARTTLVER